MRAALAALLLLASPALADEPINPNLCYPVETVLKIHEGAGSQVVVLDTDQAARAGKWLNETPPVSNLPVNTFLVVRQRNGIVAVQWGPPGKVCGGGPLPPELVRELMNAIGHGA